MEKSHRNSYDVSHCLLWLSRTLQPGRKESKSWFHSFHVTQNSITVHVYDMGVLMHPSVGLLVRGVNTKTHPLRQTHPGVLAVPPHPFSAGPGSLVCRPCLHQAPCPPVASGLRSGRHPQAIGGSEQKKEFNRVRKESRLHVFLPACAWAWLEHVCPHGAPAVPG